MPLAPWRATNPHSPLLGWSIGRGCLRGRWHFDNFSISSSPSCLMPVPRGVSSDWFSSSTPTIAELLLVQGLLFGLLPSWWHASLLGLIQQQLIPLFLLITFNNSRVFSFYSLGSTYGGPIKDRLHSFWSKVSCDSTQCICHCIIPSLLVFQLEIEFC